jgi:hypothetical protein
VASCSSATSSTGGGGGGGAWRRGRPAPSGCERGRIPKEARRAGKRRKGEGSGEGRRAQAGEVAMGVGKWRVKYTEDVICLARGAGK